jgi:hypothetical protein
MKTDSWPAWLVEQRRFPARAKGAWSRRELTRRWVKHLLDHDRPVTHDAIREMLRFVDRGYSLEPDQISRSLHGFFESGRVTKMPNGRPLIVDGIHYPSALQASEAHGVTRQTVLNRAASEDQRWRDWQFL